MTGGTASTMLRISSRASAVENWLMMPAETAIRRRPIATPAIRVDRRESRTVFAKTLPSPKMRLIGETVDS